MGKRESELVTALACRFLNSKFPGSAGEARVLRSSNLTQLFNGPRKPFSNAKLLGDKAYLNLNWLIANRLRHPPNLQDYYIRQAKCRRVVECAFGVVKNRFPVLSTGIRVKSPEFASKIIMSCFALHNFIINQTHDNYIDEGREML